MKTDKKILKSASFIAGAFLTTSLAAAPTMSPDILAYNDLGSGAQVRSHLIGQNLNQVNSSESTAYKFGELNAEKENAEKENVVRETRRKKPKKRKLKLLMLIPPKQPPKTPGKKNPRKRRRNNLIKEFQVVGLV